MDELKALVLICIVARYASEFINTLLHMTAAGSAMLTV